METELHLFVQRELKPRLFASLSSVFPEMHFKPYKGGWGSSLGLYARETTTSRPDKCRVTQGQPDRILEQGGETVELIEYYQRSHNLSKPIEAIKEISSLLGLIPPTMEESPQYKAYKERQDKLSRLVEKAQRELFTAEGAAALRYLTQERGYSEELIKEMGLGWCSTDTAAALKDILREGVVPAAGNYVAIPYICSGEIRGVVFRNTGKEGAKYLDAFISKETTKRHSLFGLTGLPLKGTGAHDKEIVVVEGELDALRAQTAGLENVVGAAGKNLSQEALTEAKRMGVERVILLLDYDKKGTPEEQLKADAEKDADIKRALGTIRSLGLTGLVAAFPEAAEKVDTDSYLAEHSVEELKGLVYGAQDGCLWELGKIIAPYCREINAIEQDKLRREVTAFMYSGLLRWEQDILLSQVEALTGGIVTEHTLREGLFELEEAQKAEQQKQAAEALLKDAQELLSKGETAAALTTLQERAKEAQGLTQEAAYSRYMQLPTSESILAGLKTKKGGIPTGYYFENRKGEPIEWEIPTGALTYICAPTSHGKSRLLQNLALTLAHREGAGSVIYISLEEDTDAVIERLINIEVNAPLNRGKKTNAQTIREYYGEGSTRYLQQDAEPILQAAYSEIEELLTSGALRLYSRRDNRDIGYIEELTGFIRYAVKQGGVQAVFIDYAQEIYSKHSKGKSRKDELMDICNSLMEISVATGLPIVLAAQLNREAASPLDMSVQNIADASNIEHSANCVLLLWDSAVYPVAGRDNSYSYSVTSQGVKTKKLTEEAEALESRGFKMGSGGQLYAILAKNRSGERNMDAVLEYDGNTGKVKPNTPAPTSEEEGEQDSTPPFDDGNIL